MYSYADRLRAVELYIRLGKRLNATIRQLGYPTKNALRGWYREYLQHLDLRVQSAAGGVEKDLNAVRNAIISPWSNGQTEGQITRLKLIKRQMYGRAKLDLLQARLIGAS